MPQQIVAPCGSWKSPITPDLIVAETIGLGIPPIVLDRDDVYWTEFRPADAGRYVIVKRSAKGQTTDVTPKTFNARTTVHEYGGGAYTVVSGVVYFTNFGINACTNKNLTPILYQLHPRFIIDTRILPLTGIADCWFVCAKITLLLAKQSTHW